MKRLLTFSGAAIFLASPLFALAAFSRPSEMLFARSIGNPEGKPVEFTTTLYGEFNDGNENFQLFSTISGMVEGKTLKTDRKDTYKANVFIDFSMITSADTAKIAGNMEMRMYGDKIYMRIADLSVQSQDKSDAEIAEELRIFDEKIKGKWFVFDAAMYEEMATNNTSVRWSDNIWQDIAEANDFGITADQLREVTMQVLDAMFRMDAVQFQGGFSYVLSLKPHFLREGWQAFIAWSKTNKPELMTSLPMDPDDPQIMSIDEELSKTLTMKVKMDTNEEGDFRFGKYFLSASVPDSNFSFSFEGKFQHRALPVYVSIPGDAQAFEALLEDMGFPSLVPTQEPPTPEETTVPPTQPSDRGCLQEQSAEKVDLIRKGMCPSSRKSRRLIRGESEIVR